MPQDLQLFDRYVISPSVIATSRADTFLIRGRRGLCRFWLHLMGELSAKPTEGEKLIDRCTYAIFLP